MEVATPGIHHPIFLPRSAVSAATLCAVVTLSFALPCAAGNQWWQIRADEGFLGFSVQHWGVVTVHGQFTSFFGEAVIDDAQPEHSRLDVSIDTRSVFSGNGTRDKHLQSADFFDTERYPQARFVSVQTRSAKDGLLVEGTLTLRGVSKPVVLHVTELSPERRNASGAPRRGVHATTMIRRQDFGLVWNKLGGDAPMVGDEVTLTADLELVPATEHLPPLPLAIK